MATRKKPQTGPKPAYQVVEDHILFCQTAEGEIRLDLRVPIKGLELFMELDGGEVEDKKIPRFLLDNIVQPEEKERLESMRDGAKVFEILMTYANKVSERLGAGLGESQGSTDSSASTEPNSEPTSDDSTD